MFLGKTAHFLNSLCEFDRDDFIQQRTVALSNAGYKSGSDSLDQVFANLVTEYRA